ncbi:PREDICTED: uncharacterized protein LOC104777597 [Camelina sativa]|uniref:Uncharacterized protein LOC104777597 n=1 Tax=Camelina sativa TaxID=90675 RepID=A0ABM0YFK5_CAMSA|nr:PREDICTED: uncharacterized protein LOC104777597 [Camelina sativa]
MISYGDGLIKPAEIPIFNGFYPCIWISKVERFFRFSQNNDVEKIRLVSSHLEGDALSWFKHVSFTNWKDFKSQLYVRFGNINPRGPPIQTSAYEVVLVKYSMQESNSAKKENNFPEEKPLTEKEESVCVKKLSHQQASDLEVAGKRFRENIKMASVKEKERLKSEKKRRFLKAWRFKFKDNKSESRKLIKHQLFSSEDGKSIGFFLHATVRLVQRRRRFQSLKRRKQAAMSLVMSNLRMMQVSKGLKQLIYGDMQPLQHAIGGVNQHLVLDEAGSQEHAITKVDSVLVNSTSVNVKIVDKAQEDRVCLVGDWNSFFSVWHRWRNMDLYQICWLNQQSLQQIKEKTSIQNDGGTHEESITQLSHQFVALSHLQVPISTLEPSHRNRSAYLGVLERFPSASMRKTSA